jgi:aminoglycoside phosphotransferase (APT) family kinase protein
MSDPAIDGAQAVRAGEEIDALKLRDYLAAHLIEGPIEISQFPSGHSNLTYLVKAGERELVLRRPPFGSKVKTAHDMGREVRILSRLSAVYPPAPKPIVYCEDSTIMGAPFYLMERIRGIILRRTPPTGIDLGPERARALGESFIDNLAALHSIDYHAAGLGDLGRPEGYNERQVTGWTKRYRDSQTDEIPDLERIAAWLAERIPKESGAALIHNDYKYDNIVLDANDIARIIGVLDWEMSTVGDPLMDLGTALGYWVQADDAPELRLLPFGPTDVPGSPTRRELAERYAAKTRRDVSGLLFYFCFALFKTAVVLQQIYYRFKHGLTKDERFAMMIAGVKILSATAVHAAESGRV